MAGETWQNWTNKKCWKRRIKYYFRRKKFTWTLSDFLPCSLHLLSLGLHPKFSVSLNFCPSLGTSLPVCVRKTLWANKEAHQLQTVLYKYFQSTLLSDSVVALWAKFVTLFAVQLSVPKYSSFCLVCYPVVPATITQASLEPAAAPSTQPLLAVQASTSLLTIFPKPWNIHLSHHLYLHLVHCSVAPLKKRTLLLESKIHTVLFLYCIFRRLKP